MPPDCACFSDVRWRRGAALLALCSCFSRKASLLFRQTGQERRLMARGHARHSPRLPSPWDLPPLPPPPKERPRVLPSCLSSVPDAYAKSKNFVQVRRRLGTTAVSTSDCSALCLPAQARPNSRAQLHHDASRASRPGCLAWPGLALQWPLPSRSTYIQSLPSLSPYPRDANTRPGRPGTTGTHLHLHLHLHLGAQMGRRSEHRGTVMPAPYCLSFRPDPKETTTQRARSGGRAPWQP